MAGYPVTDADVNNRAGQLVSALAEMLDQVREFQLWLGDAIHDDAWLAGLGINGADAALIRASFADLGGDTGLWAVAHGKYVPAGANDFFYTAKNLTGINFTG